MNNSENAISNSKNSPSKEEIMKRLKDPEDDFDITPIVFPELQINNAAVDVRLGNEFITTRRIKFGTIDPIIKAEELDAKIKQYQEETYVELGQKIVIHPQQLVLGSTLEHVRLPKDLLAYVIGRSSWGRLGLIIATATVVNPGYSGALTLELTNVGSAPVTLYPGSRIAQLVFQPVSPSESIQESKYETSIGPLFSRIYLDKEWDAFRILVEKQKSKI